MAKKEEPEEQQEMFPAGSIDGDGKTLKTLIPSGATVKHTVSVLSAEVPGGASGLTDPNGVQRVLIDCEAAGYEEIPLREEGRVVEWKIRSKLRPIHIQRVSRGTAGELEAHFKQLCLDDAKAAGKALESMRRALEAELQTA